MYSSEDFEAEVKRLTGGQGVEVVYDGVGQATFAKSLNCLKPRGYMVLYGQASGPVDPINPQILNQKGSIFLTRPSLGHYLLTRRELLQRSLDLFSWMLAGKLRVRVDRTFALAEAAAAQTYMEQRGTRGKDRCCRRPVPPNTAAVWPSRVPANQPAAVFQNPLRRPRQK